MTEILLKILEKKIKAAYILFLLAGLLLGAFFSFNLPYILEAHTKKALNYDDLGIKTAAEEDIIAEAVRKEAIAEENARNLSAKKKFDGPAFSASMPVNSKAAWLQWMTLNLPSKKEFLEKRWNLANSFIATGELKRWEDVHAFLLTPREHFVRAVNKGHEYDDTWMPIGWGATITDPDVVAMMTTTLNVRPSDKVLEIGTGSGYQAAILSFLCTNVYTIEIIRPLFYETDTLYTDLEASYKSYGSIKRKLGDGYYGWAEEAPFDKIIVTCSIDHIPPPLLQQLKPGGIMVLPLGPPGRQYIMEVKKELDNEGNLRLKRRDVYNGLWVNFIPFRNEAGDAYQER